MQTLIGPRGSATVLTCPCPGGPRPQPRARSGGGWLTRAVCLGLLSWLASLNARAAEGAQEVSLAGKWRFELDPQDLGVKEQWFTRPLTNHLNLPGALQSQGFGNEVSVDTKWTGAIVDRSWYTAPEYAPYREPGQVKLPFWLQPDRHYVGPAWYQRELIIPPSWNERRIVLSLERCHWETQVWVDDQRLGLRNSLSAPQVYDLTGRLSAGRHRLTVRVDNTVKIDVGENAHSVSDHTQGNWNGIVGDLKLVAGSRVWLEDVQVYPEVGPRLIRVQARLGNAAGASGSGQLTLRADAFNTRLPHRVQPKSVAFELKAEGALVEVEYPLGAEAQLWDEFSPSLYRLTVTLNLGGASGAYTDQRQVVFGLRQLGQQGTQFTINGRKLFLRGTLECCIFPRTGYPPTDKAAWRRVILACQAHGLNHMRFHSWCPPEAAFAAADELGFYYHVECAAWANVDDKAFGEFLYAESERIQRQYGNHPSFCLLAYGNEPAGDHQKEFLAAWVKHWKARDPRRKYTTAAGWPNLPENDFQSTPTPRIQAWGGGLTSRINAKPPETVTDYSAFISNYPAPVISHEIGQWCVYPNLREIVKYSGPLKAKNFEIFRDTLEAHHMLDQADKFLLASGKLQALCYKEDIESALRTSGFGGFQLLDLHDFPGQGTALVGVLDPFWESKGYITSEEYRRFAGETVPLALLPKRVFAAGETLQARIKVAHFGPKPLPDTMTLWHLTDVRGKVLASGSVNPRTIPVGNEGVLGELSAPLTGINRAQKLRLTVVLKDTPYANDWDLWVYPPLPPPPQATPDVLVTRELDDQAVAALEAGGKVLLMLDPTRVKGDQRGRVALGFSSIFWNTAWTGRQAPHTLGILCDPGHPALADFPTDFHSNWQWWYVLRQAQAMILDELPAELRPVVQVIDDWFTNRRLGLVLEAKVGHGRLLMTSIDLERGWEQNLVIRQLRHSLLRYMGGTSFKPEVSLDPAQVRSLIGPPRAIVSLGAKVVHTDSAEPGQEGEKAIDGDPATLWHTAWSSSKPDFPHELQLELPREAKLRGFTVLPRQDGNRNGRFSQYAFYVSNDRQNWGEPAAQGTLPNDAQLKTMTFERVRAGRFVRLVALQGIGAGPWAAIAELDLLPAE